MREGMERIKILASDVKDKYNKGFICIRLS